MALGALSAVLSGTALFMDAYTWRGWAPAALSAFVRSDLLAAPFAAVVGAWVGGRPQRYGLRDWCTAMPRTLGSQFEQEAAFLLRMVVTHTLVLVSLIASLCAVYSSGVPPETAWLATLPVTTAASMMTWGVVGTLVGKLAPLWVAGLLSLTIPYAVNAAVIWLAPQTFVETLAVYSGGFYVEAIPDPVDLLIRMAFWVSLCLLLVSALAWRRKLRAFAGFVCWVTLSLAVLGGAPRGVPIHGATTPVCISSDIRVCVDAAHRTVLEQYAAAARASYERVPTPLKPSGFQPAALQGGRTYDRGVVGVGPVKGNWDVAFDLDAGQFTARTGNAIFLRSCASEASGESLEKQALNLWWRRSHGLRDDIALFPGDIGEVMADDWDSVKAASLGLDSLDDAERDLWARTHVADLLRC